MPNFESGVSGFIKGFCRVEVNFPIDGKGRADVCCEQCPYYGRTSKTCQINKQVVHYSNKLGFFCPLQFSGEVKPNEND